jgi:hypothetical protein
VVDAGRDGGAAAAAADDDACGACGCRQRAAMCPPAPAASTTGTTPHEKSTPAPHHTTPHTTTHHHTPPHTTTHHHKPPHTTTHHHRHPTNRSTVVGAGATGGAMDASNLLKPQLARGELRCIGATTLDEYRKYIEKDPALERRFQQVRPRGGRRPRAAATAPRARARVLLSGRWRRHVRAAAHHAPTQTHELVAPTHTHTHTHPPTPTHTGVRGPAHGCPDGVHPARAARALRAAPRRAHQRQRARGGGRAQRPLPGRQVCARVVWRVCVCVCGVLRAHAPRMHVHAWPCVVAAPWRAGRRATCALPPSKE